MRFWVYFAGTFNGSWIEAANMASAKALFAKQQGVALSSYIQASQKAPIGARELQPHA